VAFRDGNLSVVWFNWRVAIATYNLVLCARQTIFLEHPTISEPQIYWSMNVLGFSHTELRTHWPFLPE